MLFIVRVSSSCSLDHITFDNLEYIASIWSCYVQHRGLSSCLLSIMLIILLRKTIQDFIKNFLPCIEVTIVIMTKGHDIWKFREWLFTIRGRKQLAIIVYIFSNIIWSHYMPLTFNHQHWRHHRKRTKFRRDHTHFL